MTRCRLMYGGLASALAIGVAVLPGCGGGESPTVAGPTTTGSAAGSAEGPTTTTAGQATQRPPGGTPPEELQGTWLTDFGGGPARLYIRGDRYAVSAGGSAQGDVVVDGAVIAFFNANGD